MSELRLADTSNTCNFIEKKGRGWRAIKDAPRDGTVIDVWVKIHASPMSMGFSDEFGVPDAWFENGKWVHMYRGRATELYTHYVTHWRPKKSTPAAHTERKRNVIK